MRVPGRKPRDLVQVGTCGASGASGAEESGASGAEESGASGAAGEESGASGAEKRKKVIVI